MDVNQLSAVDYENRYQTGYGHVYPESHIIRVHRQILQWELKLNTGKIFDFGCGSGANLKYFTENSFVPFGCDTSGTAIETCKKIMPDFANNFFVNDPIPKLKEQLQNQQFDIFLSNQVLYYFNDQNISEIIQQAFDLLNPDGVFIATMMANSCWYSRFINGEEGDFKIVEIETPREKNKSYINFKDREELEDLFQPFTKLHIGSYGSHIREEEGSTDHWLYVGIKS